jgi:hypothetical protein
MKRIALAAAVVLVGWAAAKAAEPAAYPLKPRPAPSGGPVVAVRADPPAEPIPAPKPAPGTPAETIPAPKPAPGTPAETIPAPQRAPAVAAAPPAGPGCGCNGGCDTRSCRERLCDWLTYKPLHRTECGECKVCCHGPCCCTPPLYLYFLHDCRECRFATPCCAPCADKCGGCGFGCAGHGMFGMLTGHNFGCPACCH